jgi:hypothetical protein
MRAFFEFDRTKKGSDAILHEEGRKAGGVYDMT